MERLPLALLVVAGVPLATSAYLWLVERGLALLTDRVPYERVAKGIVFLPMAISFVAASVIWKFMYDYRPPGLPQTGAIDAVVTAVGAEPHAWLIESRSNNLALIAVAVWTWV